MIVKESSLCDSCYRPAGKRLALYAPQGQYQCYAESYVKCFWGLCDLPHKSNENLIRKTEDTVITEQPKAQPMPYKNPITKEMIIYGIK